VNERMRHILEREREIRELAEERRESPEGEDNVEQGEETEPEVEPVNTIVDEVLGEEGEEGATAEVEEEAEGGAEVILDEEDAEAALVVLEKYMVEHHGGRLETQINRFLNEADISDADREAIAVDMSELFTLRQQLLDGLGNEKFYKNMATAKLEGITEGSPAWEQALPVYTDWAERRVKAIGWVFAGNAEITAPRLQAFLDEEGDYITGSREKEERYLIHYLRNLKPWLQKEIDARIEEIDDTTAVPGRMVEKE